MHTCVFRMVCIVVYGFVLLFALGGSGRGPVERYASHNVGCRRVTSDEASCRHEVGHGQEPQGHVNLNNKCQS